MNTLSLTRLRPARKFVILLLSLSLAAVLLAACGSNKAQENETPETPAAVTNEEAASTLVTAVEESAAEPSLYPMTVTDEMGHELTIPSKPQRIFAPVMEDYLVALGIKPALQWSNGTSPQLYLQDQLGDVPEISFASGLPSSESVLSYTPDLIILHSAYYAGDGVYEQYAKIAPTYVYENASHDVGSSIRKLAELLGEPEAAEQAAKDYEASASLAREKLAKLTEGKKAAIIRFNARGMFFMGPDYYSGYVLAHDLGFAPSKLVQEGAFEVSLEVLPELDADYIFLVNDGNQGDAFLKELKESIIWERVPAVKNGQVYETTRDYWLAGGYVAQSKVIADVVGFLAP